MKVISIDPGLTGAVGIFQDGELVELHDIPTIENGGGFVKRRVDAEALAELLWPHCRAQAVIEWVTAMPGNGSSSMFSFGATLGCCLGVLGALGIHTTKFTPREWHKVLDLEKQDSKAAGKAFNRSMAARLHPSHAHMFKRVKDHDRADAVLLGHALMNSLKTTNIS